MKFKYEWFKLILVGFLVKPVVSTTVGSKQFEKSSLMVLTNTMEKKENKAPSEYTKLSTLKSEHKSDKVFYKDKLDTLQPNDSKILPDIEWLIKIVSMLQSNDKEMKNKMAQLTERVSYLESLIPFETKQSAGNKNRNKRNIVSDSKPACAIKACAFDYGTKTSINLRPVCTIKACAFDYGQDEWVKSRIPTNCKDLQAIGHVMNGFYSVLTDGKIQLVFCNFNPAKIQGMETPVGFMDIKSFPVYFFLQKAKARYSVNNVPMPFEITNLNVGNAMNTTTGIFTAPKAGIYYFAFSGIKDWDAGSTFLFLQLNGNNVGVAHATGIRGGLAMTLHSTLKLQAGDKVSLVLTEGIVHDFYEPYTSFVGWLLEEHEFVV